MENISETIFISYSHDSKEHKEKIRNMADVLRIEYGINVTGDFYEEDNPAGGQLSDFMERIRECSRVICVLSPIYKIKADEGKGGVGYEKTIITDQLYQDIGSNKFIPISFCTDVDYKDLAPNFLTSTRKAIIKKAYESDSDFIEEIARVIHYSPRQPKPPLGKNKLSSQPEAKIDATKIIIDNITEPSNHEIIFKNALFYAKSNDEINFRLLLKRVKKKVFADLISLREERAATVNILDEIKLHEIMDEFINTAAPLFLMAFAGYLSFNEKFINQEGLLIDLLTMDGWNNLSGKAEVYNIPRLLAYVYHHVYGALDIDNNRMHHLSRIFEQKIPSENGRNYDYLYKSRSVTGWIDSLGRDCFKSFSYLLNCFQRWNWIGLLFDDEMDFQKSLVCYQASLNVMNYLMSVKNKNLDSDDYLDLRCHVPPSAMIADSKLKNYARHYLIKNGDFFKKYSSQQNISHEDAIEKWKLWLGEISKFNTMGNFHLWLFDLDIMADILR